MKIDLTLWGSNSDVNSFLTLMKKAFSNIDFVEVDFFPGNYPNDDSDLIVKVFALREVKKMNLEYRIIGLPDDVELAINGLRDSYPESSICCSRPFPQGTRNKDIEEIAVYVTISGGNK